MKYKNINSRLLVKENEKKKIVCKVLHSYFLSLKKSKILTVLKKKRTFFRYSYAKASKNNLAAPCIITNRSKGVFKKFGASRFVLRNLMSFGLIPGYKKSVW